MSQSKFIQQYHGHLFLLGLLFCYMAPDLASQSMALDGLVYANVAKLLAAGQGSFWWLPNYSTDLPRFTDHPPLGIYLHSLWMSVAGSAWWSDKLYTSLLSLLWLMLVLALARPQAPQTDKLSPQWWIIVLVALLPPVTYTLRSAFLEISLSITILAAVWCARKAHERTAWAVPAGFACAAAVLIKGPVGLFPLAAPAILMLARDWAWPDIRNAIGTTAIMLLCVSSLLVLTMLGEDAQSWFSVYINNQVIDSITGVRPADHGRVYLLQHLVTSLLILAMLAALLSRGKPLWNRTALMWLVMGMAYALPLLLSSRHYRHYLFPALPFFALAAWSVLPDVGRSTMNRCKPIWWLPGLAAVLWMALVWGKPGSDGEEIADSKRIAAHIAADTQVREAGICPQDESVTLAAYLFRRGSIKTSRHTRAYMVCTNPPAADYQLVSRLSDGVNLWHKPPAVDAR